MSATLTCTKDLIEALAVEVEAVNLHPATARQVSAWFWDMRGSFENPAKVVHLMRLVREAVAQELRFQAEDVPDATLHHSADAFEFASVVGSKANRFARNWPEMAVGVDTTTGRADLVRCRDLNEIVRR